MTRYGRGVSEAFHVKRLHPKGSTIIREFFLSSSFPILQASPNDLEFFRFRTEEPPFRPGDQFFLSSSSVLPQPVLQASPDELEFFRSSAPPGGSSVLPWYGKKFFFIIFLLIVSLVLPAIHGFLSEEEPEEPEEPLIARTGLKNGGSTSEGELRKN